MKYTIEIKEDVAGLGLVKGFKTAGVACDIRNKGDMQRLDLALVVSDCDASAAGVFTTNDVKAAPVLTDIKKLSNSPFMRAIVANSGNANACTGERGIADAERMCEIASQQTSLDAAKILVCSTGRIGEFLPMEKLEKGITDAAKILSNNDESSKAAASAILTSDTRSKTVIAKISCECGKSFSIAGMAKGAGMIEPNMATMLSFIASDAKVSPEFLKKSLRLAAQKTFNRITVDGDMSTNDTVLVLANGMSGVEISEENSELAEAFQKALLEVSRILAKKIVGDGEKISKVVEVRVRGANDEIQAEKICRAIGNSLLVKSSWFGEDPNWGRLVDSAGYARTGLNYEKLDLYYDDIPVLERGRPISENKPKWKEAVRKKTFLIDMNLNLGNAEESILATDLTEAYVNFNKSE